MYESENCHQSFRIPHSSNVLHQHIPYGNDVADASCQHEEVEHGMHITRLVETVEHCSRYIAHALSDYPNDSCCRNRIDKRLEGYKHRQSHTHKAERLHITVFLEPDKTHDSSCYGAEPYEHEQRPSPVQGKGGSCPRCQQRHSRFS